VRGDSAAILSESHDDRAPVRLNQVTTSSAFLPAGGVHLWNAFADGPNALDLTTAGQPAVFATVPGADTGADTFPAARQPETIFPRRERRCRAFSLLPAAASLLNVFERVSSGAIGDRRGIRSPTLLPGSVDHGHDARLDRFGQVRPGVNEALQIGVDCVKIGRMCAGFCPAEGTALRFFQCFAGVVRFLSGLFPASLLITDTPVVPARVHPI
jgi:hypothetical protein